MKGRGGLEFGTIVVVGGGCYGSYYVRQLQRARGAGRAAIARIVVVDRDARCAVARGLEARPDPGVVVAVADWEAFFTHWLGEATADPAAHARSAIVPSPLMPHLLYAWLAAQARAVADNADLRGEAPGDIPGVPWQNVGADGTRYVSFATWICPINCIEPARCPHTRGPRDWSLHRTLTVPAGSDDTALLPVTHRTFGVGMIDVTDVLAARAVVLEAVRHGRGARVATASHCHGAVGLVRVRRAASTSSP